MLQWYFFFLSDESPPGFLSLVHLKNINVVNTIYPFAFPRILENPTETQRKPRKLTENPSKAIENKQKT